MSILIEAYRRLLVDIQDLSRIPLGVPDEISYEWVHKDAPLLEKQVLMYLEGSRLEQPIFPEWLKPLWEDFLITNKGETLKYIRNALLFCYKTEYEPSNEQTQAAQAAFEETDRYCSLWDTAFESGSLAGCRLRSARQMVSHVIGRINWYEIVPSHGPGSVFPSCKPGDKSRFMTYYTSIQQYYPYDKYLWCLPSYWGDIMWHESKGRIVERECITAKLVCVPKDSRGPRLICVHPKEAIWIQQGQRALLEHAISTYAPLKGRINFTDQTVNGRLALASSQDKRFVTLDLKEASDRISKSLVKFLFGNYTYDILSCARASKIRLLDGRVIALEKWAPMGNALTFPVQSLIFWSLVRAGIRSRYGVICNDIYVFGDDILFPSEYYDGAIEGLTCAGMVPNMGKTFRRGFFRESCGVDAYLGIDVTPYRMKKADVTSAQDAMAFLDLAKRLRLGKFEHCSSFLYSCVAKRFGKLPFCNNPMAQGFVEYVERDLGWLFLNEPRLRFRKTVHQFSVPCRLVNSVISNRVNDDWYHLQDSLWRITRKGDTPSDRGTEYPIPYRTRLTYGWADCHYS